MSNSTSLGLLKQKSAVFGTSEIHVKRNPTLKNLQCKENITQQANKTDGRNTRYQEDNRYWCRKQQS